MDPEEGVDFVGGGTVVAEYVVDQLRRTHLRAMLWVAVQSLSGDWYRAEDAVQEAFVAVYRKAAHGDFKNLNAAAGYLRLETRSKAIDDSRRQARRDRVERKLLQLPVDFEQTQALDASLMFDVQRVRRAIAALSARQREVIFWHYYAALSVEEIASILEISKGTVKSTLSDARQQLRRRLEEPQ